MKLIFIFNNFIFLLIGLVAIGFGLWGVIRGEKVFEEEWFPQIEDKKLERDLRNNIKHAFTWLIIGAVILAGIAVLGFCGGWRENRCILGVFFLILFVLTLIFLAALILFYAFPAFVGRQMDAVLELQKDEFLTNRKKDNTTTISKNLAAFQQSFKCCLFNETVAEDYKIKSCYENWGKEQNAKPNDAVVFKQSCSTALIERLKEFLANYKTTFALIVVVTIIICVIQMILSLYICCKIKGESYETMK